MSSWALGPFLQVIRKAYPGTRRSRKLRGRSAEGPRKPESQHWIHTHAFASEILSSLPMGNPNELLLVRPQVAATRQLHSYGNDLLSLWPRVASKSQLDLHESLHECYRVSENMSSVGWNLLYVYSQYRLMRAHPVTCLSTYPRQRSQPKRACAGTFAVVLEDLSRKQIPKSSRKTFAEAAAEGGSKKD